MCLSNSVGLKAVNNSLDVKTVQILLNMNIRQITPLKPLTENGICDKLTINAITEYQKKVLCYNPTNGQITPNSLTLQKLKDGMPLGFTAEKLQGIMISATKSTVLKYFDALKYGMLTNGITSPLRMAHFLAQLGHESKDFIYTEEIASGADYEGNDDIGNTEPGDGKRFKGRGLIQITGRYNYEAYGKARGKDYTSDENSKLLATNSSLAVDVAIWFWSKKKLNNYADNDNIRKITYIINGGYNGFQDRKSKLERAKFFITR